MAELEGFERISSLAFSVCPIYCKEVPRWPADILKKIDVVNFERAEVVRDFQTAEARELKAICEEP
jgi:hypothetical protein